MASFVQRLIDAQGKLKSWLCVGLDWDHDKMPPAIAELYAIEPRAAIIMFFKNIIDATAPYCSAYKPNMAFFEAEGRHGLKALGIIVAYIHEKYPNHLVILDGKRGDIGKTADKYAASLKELGADVVTVNPYLGPLTLEPYLKVGLGIIGLCVTSNPDAAIFQNKMVIIPDGVGDMPDREMPLYQYVAKTLTSQHLNPKANAVLWTDNVGLVTGATHPEPELREVRERVGARVPLLIPGIGSQAGSLEEVMTANGGGLAIINSSSGICYASKTMADDYAHQAGAAACELNDAINALRQAA